MSHNPLLPQHFCMHDLVDSMKMTPGKKAIMAQEREDLTYGQLCRQIEYVVSFLNRHGLGRNDRIAVIVPDGPEMAIVFLGIMACATFVPFSPHNSKEEYEFLMEKMEIKTLLVHEATDTPALSVADRSKMAVIELNRVAEAAGIFKLSWKRGTKGSAGKRGFADPDETAMVLNTSGSTSQPKIVPLTQFNIFSSAHYIAAALHLVSSDRSLHILSMTHIAGLVSSLISPLMTGGSIICASKFSEDKFFEWLRVFRPTWYTAVPAIHKAVIEMAEGKPHYVANTSLRFIRTIASPIAETVIEKLEGIFHIPVIQAYGMTEALSIACTPLDPYKRKPGSVGVPLCPDIAIINEEGSLLRSGQAGEIAVRGPHVFKGYENNPEANQNAFAQEWFKTGDIGHIDDEGYLYVTGRLKEIINRGGQKVSPQEVESILMSHPAVQDGCVFGVFHRRLGEAVVAAVVLKDSYKVPEREIRQYLAERLISYKVPQQIIFVDTIPRNNMGKVQRTGMSEMFIHLLKSEFIAPETESEIMLAKIWSEVLGLSQVGSYDNFFALGGDSLLATQVVSRIRKEAGIDLPLLTVFQYTTLEGLAAVISQDQLNTANEKELSDLIAEIEGHTEKEVKEKLKYDINIL